MSSVYKLYMILALMSCILIVSCSPKLILDPTDHRLPAYTITGNDVAGAIIDDQAWASSSFLSNIYFEWADVELNSFENDSLVLHLAGNLGSQEMDLDFHLSSIEIDDFNDIANFSNMTFKLDGIDNSASLTRYKVGETEVLTGGVGQLHLRKAEITTDSIAYIISGTFGYSLNIGDSAQLNVFYGRFDYKLRTRSNYFIEL